MAAVAEKGYDATRVSDIVATAGISRNTFYRHFSDKEQCVCAAIDGTVDFTATRVVGAYRQRRGDCRIRLGAALETLLDLAIQYPKAAKVGCVDVYVVGPTAIARAARLEQLLEQMVADADARSTGVSAPPPEVVRAVIGGLRQMIHSRVRAGRQHDLLRLGPELFDWAMGYAIPNDAQVATFPVTRPPMLAMRPAMHDAADPRVRMLVAVAELAVTKGYTAMTITEIADRAHVSLTTFYNHFSSKEEALLASASYGEQLLLEEALPAYQAAPSWPEAVRDGLLTFLGFLSANPSFARLGLLDVFSGGPAALDWRETSVARFQALMHPGYEHYPRTPRIAAEAVGAAIAATLYDRLTSHGPEGLLEMAPLAIFVALAPFVGTSEAALHATRPG
jgi:AcrR family transcriptional regulator